jgi:hypothetical protein
MKGADYLTMRFYSTTGIAGKSRDFGMATGRPRRSADRTIWCFMLLSVLFLLQTALARLTPAGIDIGFSWPSQSVFP